MTRTRVLGRLGGAAFLALALGCGAHAQDGKPVAFAFNIGANSDYVLRGVSYSAEKPTVFGGIDATFGIGYAGLWVSNVDFGNGTKAEFDLYAGLKPVAGPVTFDIGFVRYGFIDQPARASEDFWEAKIAASVPAGPALLGAAVYYSPEFFRKTGEAWYYEVNAVVPIPSTKFTLSGAIGRQEVAVGPDYTNWNAGVGFALTDHVSLDIRYWDTAKHKLGDISSSRVVGGVKVVF